MTEAILKNVAIIGCGIGRLHLAEGYANHRDKFRVLALCDIDAARLDKLGAEFGVTRLSTSFDEILSMDDVEVIDICTPPGLHYPQILAARTGRIETVDDGPRNSQLIGVRRQQHAPSDPLKTSLARLWHVHRTEDQEQVPGRPERPHGARARTLGGELS